MQEKQNKENVGHSQDCPNLYCKLLPQQRILSEREILRYFHEKYLISEYERYYPRNFRELKNIPKRIQAGKEEIAYLVEWTAELLKPFKDDCPSGFVFPIAMVLLQNGHLKEFKRFHKLAEYGFYEAYAELINIAQEKCYYEIVKDCQYGYIKGYLLRNYELQE